jgi:hypothetical protein
MTKFLDLRQKVEPPVKIVYQTVVNKRPWYIDLTKTLLVIVITITVVWGVSKADIDQTTTTAPAVTSFSVLGLISDLTDSSFSVNNINISEYAPAASYTFDTSTLQKIETNEYAPLQFSDLKLGDKIIVQGTSENNILSAIRIIDFTSTPASVATTTPLEATSTDETASSTATTSLIDNAIDTVQNIIDVFTSTTTSTSTDETDTTIASTTPETPPTPAVSPGDTAATTT